MSRHEEMSSWMDGESDAKQADALPSQIVQDDESRKRWNQWHLIGDVMRSPSLGRYTALAERVSKTLTSEAAHLPSAELRSSRRRIVQRSRMAAALAVAAAVGFVAVVAIAPQMEEGGVSGLIAASGFGSKTPAASAEQVSSQLAAEDPRLRDLLETHGSMSIRPVSFEAR